MAAAEFSLGVLFIASTLPHLLDFYFVMGKLRRSLCTGTDSFACGQRSYPRRRPWAARLGSNSFILLEGFCAYQTLGEEQTDIVASLSEHRPAEDSQGYSFPLVTVPADRSAPRILAPRPRANIKSRNPSICWLNDSP